VGITEPIYGPSAIRPVADQTKEKPYTEITKDDLPWEIMDTTNVETKTFYMLSDDGVIGLAQVIYSNVLYGKSEHTTNDGTDIESVESGQQHSSHPRSSRTTQISLTSGARTTCRTSPSRRISKISPLMGAR
jgi:hypothetical protein